MNIEQHSNSHVVYLLRASSFASGARKGLEDYFADSHKGVGSYYTKGGTRTATGLTIAVENLLMPLIINIPKEDRDFRKDVTEWFMNIETKVPAHKFEGKHLKGGKELEIGLETSNDEPVSEANMPLNVEDYIRYHHAIGHPFVAINEATGKGNSLKTFFVFDPEEVSLGNLTINQAKDEALGFYLTIKDKPRTVDQYLTLMGINTQLIKRGEEVLKLREVVESKPEVFLTLTRDKDKEVKYLIEEMINCKVLERVNKIILTKEGDVIGRDVKEAVLFLKDSHNTKVFATLKAQLQEAWKKKSISVETDEDLEPVHAEEKEPATLQDAFKQAKAIEDNPPLGDI